VTFVPGIEYAKWVPRVRLTDGEGVSVDLPNGDRVAVYANGQVRHLRWDSDRSLTDAVLREAD
jgi:hypothetical protein